MPVTSVRHMRPSNSGFNSVEVRYASSNRYPIDKLGAKVSKARGRLCIVVLGPTTGFLSTFSAAIKCSGSVTLTTSYQTTQDCNLYSQDCEEVPLVTSVHGG
ncbi:hypothetical protein MPTK1_2g09410 [Marchantia polymorpha subsp. ruderalis]|uniref:Uncharacterized protein n=1 Tax=Marchantia polymorpha TaxID=3197 RepID=A0A2R6W4B0_MARPO|nr:hypothetical protein MARPO_0158s0012 [Marchantia polymorpha]BBN01680.1 hypothetical protein Mp_2g09410 [Marchantia polymorpha subsp. ruderalis]|eukprot:PTQ28632.1 hypothetical protein MARPO_0158s0012 [Marchantia polymorpha]